MLSPIITLFKHFPLRAYTTVLILVWISWFAYRRLRELCACGALSRNRGMSGWLLLNYLMLLLFFTVLGRRSLDYYRWNFDVGYSYRDVLTTGDPGGALLIAANVAVFVPVGLLASLLARRLSFGKGLLCGAAVSVCIELLQLVLRCGTCEIDDLISNTLGTLLGCLLAALCRPLLRRFPPSTWLEKCGIH